MKYLVGYQRRRPQDRGAAGDHAAIGREHHRRGAGGLHESWGGRRRFRRRAALRRGWRRSRLLRHAAGRCPRAVSKNDEFCI